MEDIRSEFDAGVFEPSMQHYERYARARELPKKARQWFDSKTSIHVHFYSNDNMAQLLDHAVGERWYSAYALRHSRNAKDFHVILRK